MEAGLTVINNTGSIQIDSKFSNYYLAQKISVPTSSDGRWFDNAVIDIDGDALVFAELQHNSSIGLGECTTVSGTTRRYRFIFAGSPSIVIIYIFRRMATTSSTYGIEVYNGSGQLVFAGPNNKYLNIYKNIVYADYNGWPGEYWVPGKTYAVMFGRIAGTYSVYSQEAGGPFGYDRYEDRTAPFIQRSGNISNPLYAVIDGTVWSSHTYVGSSENWGEYNYNFVCLIADVTGL